MRKNNDEWELAEFNNLQMIGIFKTTHINASANYPSRSTDYIIAPTLLLRDYEQQHILGCSYKKLFSLFDTKDDINSGLYVFGYWEKLDKNNNVVETNNDLNINDIHTLNSLKKGDVITFEADIAVRYAVLEEGVWIKELFIDNVKNVSKVKEVGIKTRIKHLIKNL